MSDDALYEQWICTCCGYVYDPAVGDPENGIPPGVEFVNLPPGWVCPLCKALQSDFDRL